MRGVICVDGELIVTDELEVRDPTAEELRIDVVASGVCHSDVTMMRRRRDAPVVLGHEAAGIVVACGADVESVAPGDAVVVGCQKPCHRCRQCRRGKFALCATGFAGGQPFRWRGRPAYAMARVGSFATEIVVHRDQVYRYGGLHPAAAALIGCAVSTAYGNVRNVAEVGAGDVVVVIGIGGVGVNAVQVARLQGAARVVAVDIHQSKAEPAARYGADAFVLVAPGDTPAEVAAQIRAVAGEDIDAVLECSGAPSAVEAAVHTVGRGGRVAVVGQPPDGSRATFDINRMMIEGTTIKGALNGACDPFVDLPEIIRLAEQGDLDVTSQVSKVWPLDGVQDAIDAMLRGEIVRASLDMRATSHAA